MVMVENRDSVDVVVDPEFGPWLAQASILIVDDERDEGEPDGTAQKNTRDKISRAGVCLP